MSNFKVTPIISAICILGGLSSVALAQTPARTNDAETARLIKKINAQTVALEQEVRVLKSQLAEIKHQQHKTSVVTKSRTTTTVNNKRAKANPQRKSLEFGAIPVISSPYLGIDNDLNVFSLAVMLPSYNQGLRLLQQRQILENKYIAKGEKPPVPILELSGKVEAQALAGRGYDGTRHSDLDLTGAELDIIGHFSPWLTGYMALNYDNGPNPTNPVRISNSRFFLNKAFISIGDLSKSPIYATIGQRYVFGQHSSAMISSPYTQDLARVKARALLLGYQPKGNLGVYATGYVFRGDTKLNDSSHINQFGGSLGYLFKQGKFSGDIGADYINNIAESQGMQRTGMDPVKEGFAGFGASAENERLITRVPGLAAHIKLALDPFNLITEYVGATKSFDVANLSYNGAGARPQAFHVEGIYNFKVMNKISNFAIGYDRSKEAFAIGLPKQRYVAAFNIIPLKNVIASLELRRDQNYDAGTYANGQGSVEHIPSGRFSNLITAQFGIYF